MARQDQLFDLIKAMTKSEKRYFKLLATKYKTGEASNYVRLFEVIEKQKAYNEAEIKRIFAGSKFIRQITVTKRYLYSLILKSLRINHADNTIGAQIRAHLDEVDILFQKNLFSQCNKILRKARSLVYQFEQFAYLIEIINCEKKIYQAGLYRNVSEKDLDELSKQLNDIFEKLKSEDGIDNLKNKLFLNYYKELFTRDPATIDSYEQIINTPLLQEESKALTFKAKRAYYSAHIVFNGIKSNDKEKLRYTSKLEKIIRDHPERIKESPFMYIAALSNLILCQLEAGKFNEVEHTLNKLNSIPAVYSKYVNENEIMVIRQKSYSYRLDLYILTSNFKKGLALIKEINKTIHDSEQNIQEMRLVTLLMTVARFYFVFGDYEHALDYVNAILNRKNIYFAEDVHASSRLLNLILHFELHNDLLLEHLIRSTYRFLYRRKRLFQLETIILNFIRTRLGSALSAKELTEAFKSLRNDLLPLQKDPIQKQGFQYFDLIPWLESKITGRPMIEIIKKKHSGITDEYDH